MTSQTPRSTPKLSDIAKTLVVPDGIVSTGYPQIARVAAKLGATYDVWQEQLVKIIVAKRSSGLYAAGIGGVCISICRQVGKTFTIAVMIFSLCIIAPRTRVLWTAHHSRTAGETFKWMQTFCKRPRIAPYIRAVRRANGQQEVLFRNGSIIMFGARGSGYGRGYDDVDLVVFDESQILDEESLDAMVPAANAAKNPLIIYLGTPPKPKDPSEVFSRFRREAREGVLKNAVYLEIGADPDADLDDDAQLRKANPSYPHRTRKDAVLRLRAQLGDASFRREGLGIWDEDRKDAGEISTDIWEALAVGRAPETKEKTLGIAFSHDGMRMSIAGAAKKGDRVHVELIDTYSGPVEGGLASLADWICEKDAEGVPRWRRTAGIAIAGAAGASTLAQLLRERRVPERYIMLLSRQQYFAACAITLDMVNGESLTHLATGQEVLDASATSCVRDYRAGGAWGWKAPRGDETPLEAVSFAAWYARTSTLMSALTRKRKVVTL